MCIRENVETFLGVLNHLQPGASQYSLIKFNENEHVMDGLYSALFDRYLQARVLHYTGISWDRFYKEHEYWETEEILERCQKLADVDGNEVSKLRTELEGLRNANVSKR